jgi:hypothetical protein
VEATVALFAPEATIRQTRTRFVVSPTDGGPEPPLAEDAYGAGQRSLADAQAWEREPGGVGTDVLWATGTRRIRAWLPWFVAAGHRVEASAHRAEGDTVTWRHRAFADPYQGFAGVEPAEGTAEVVVRAGRIASFVFASEEETVARRARQFATAVGARIAAVPPPPRPADQGAPGPAVRATGHPSPDPPDPRLPLSLVAAALAGLAVGRHRRARSPGRPTAIGSGGGASDREAGAGEDRRRRLVAGRPRG